MIQHPLRIYSFKKKIAIEDMVTFMYTPISQVMNYEKLLTYICVNRATTYVRVEAEVRDKFFLI
jgi:hypothetical protein